MNAEDYEFKGARSLKWLPRNAFWSLVLTTFDFFVRHIDTHTLLE